jgi:hypothetical protein
MLKVFRRNLMLNAAPGARRANINVESKRRIEMPEQKAGSVQQSIARQIGSTTNAGQTNPTTPNPATVANAPGNVSGGNVPPPPLPPQGGKK